MRHMKFLAAAGLASALLSGALFSGLAIAQVYPAPQVQNINPTDLVPDIPMGGAQAQSYYALPGAIAGVPLYTNAGVTVTAFALTFGHQVTNLFMQPAGTLATGTVTTEANPSDGQRECLLSTQTQTALTWAANTGQTINNAPTAGVANTPICLQFSKATATWYRAP